MARRKLAIVVVAATGLALGAGGVVLAAAPASAGTKVYHWRTEDGTYAFTDDPKAIPDRYRDQVEVRALGGLDDYERYTPSVSSGPPGHEAAGRTPAAAGATAAGQGTAESRRIEYLRALNAPAVRGRAGGDSTQRISIPTGDGNSPVIDVPVDGDQEPVVIEQVRTRPAGSMVTRTDLVVRQGDRLLTIVKPQANETNTTSDIVDEGELLSR
jgi:hypothetical protein